MITGDKMSDVECERDEVDEDEWYARMESAAAARDDEIPEEQMYLSPSKIVNSDEADYFDRLELAAQSGSSGEAFVDESNTVWQSMLRKVANQDESRTRSITSPFVKIQSTDELNLILCQQWLFSHLPGSLTLYHMINTTFLGSYPERVVYVDHKLHPSVVFTYMYKPNPRYIHATAFCPQHVSGPILQSMGNWLYEAAKSIPTCKSLYLASTEHSLFETVFANDKRMHIEWTEICKTYICDPSAREILLTAVASLPVDYEYCDLRDEDATIVNDTWKYRSEESIHMVRKMVNGMPCRGIRHKDDGLVAWCLKYEEGPLGMLQTLPSHRKKGLGRCVVADMVLKLLKSPNNQTPPYCYIEQSNEASMGLFRSLGFYKTIDVVWSELSFP